MKKIPLIDITDLYHPHQDPGDNFDLIMPYGLPEIDLRAVILDATEEFRAPFPKMLGFTDPFGPRDPGIIPVTQLNYLFNRTVPFAVGPMRRMSSAQDSLSDLPQFQQQGVDLLLQTLRHSEEPVEIALFSSCRPLAAAYLREPKLLQEKVSRIHLSVGASETAYTEWNVALDPMAFACLLRSELPICIYPCATGEGPFSLGKHNSFWRLPNLNLIRGMDAHLKSYLWYAFTRSSRVDFLRAVDESVAEVKMDEIYCRSHSVWETAVWLMVSGRKLVKRADHSYHMLPAEQVRSDDTVLTNDLLPCLVECGDDGLFTFRLTDRPTNFSIYYRDDLEENQRAFGEALARIYASFRI